jgi:hypothetical protein
MQGKFLTSQLAYAKKICKKTHKAIGQQIADYFKRVGNIAPINVEMEEVILNGKKQWLQPCLISTAERATISDWFHHPLLFLLYLARLGVNSILLESTYLELRHFRTLIHTHTLANLGNGWVIRVPGIKKDTPVLQIARIRAILARALKIRIIGMYATGSSKQLNHSVDKRTNRQRRDRGKRARA